MCCFLSLPLGVCYLPRTRRQKKAASLARAWRRGRRLANTGREHPEEVDVPRGCGGAAAVPRRMVPSSSDHPPRIRRRCRSRRGCRRRRRRPGAGAAGRGYARRLVIRTGGSGRCLGVDRRVDRWLAARPRRVRRGSRGCGDRRSRSRRPGRGPWWDVSGGMDADGQRLSESGLDARRG